MLQDMILHGEVVSVKDNIYLPRTFAQEDETARRIAMRLIEPSAPERIEQALEQVKREMGLCCLPNRRQRSTRLTATACPLSQVLPAPARQRCSRPFWKSTAPASERRNRSDGADRPCSRRMAESTGFDKARTLHSGLGLGSEEDDANRSRQQEPLSADLIIVDEFSMVDMWLQTNFFPHQGWGPCRSCGRPRPAPQCGRRDCVPRTDRLRPDSRHSAGPDLPPVQGQPDRL